MTNGNTSPHRSWRLALLVAMVLVLTVVHDLGIVKASRFHQVLDILPYFPIMLGALWFGLIGGIVCSLVTTAGYTLHIVLHEGGGLFAENFHRTLNILMFNVFGAVVGYLSQRQLRVMTRYRALADRLEKSYTELRSKTEELFQAEEHLQRASRLSALGQLTAGLAHEIGNPLGGIKGAAEILTDGMSPKDRRYRFARLLRQEVERLEDVVSRFLDWVRPPEAMVAHAEIGQVLSSVISLCEQSVERKRLKLQLRVERGVPRVAADPRQLQHVFLNLLLNSIQATPEGGRILLRVRLVDQVLQCSVSDSGCGIPQEDIPRLFDPFFTTRPNGTGLGLAITSRILEGIKASVRVKSQVGRGSTFTVILPVLKEDSVVQEGARSR